MKPIERLARDICWAEFPRPPKDTNKREYWSRVHHEKKLEYIEDAKWLAWIIQRIPEKTLRAGAGRLNLRAEAAHRQRQAKAALDARKP